jgi:hypothetical protein
MNKFYVKAAITSIALLSVTSVSQAHCRNGLSLAASPGSADLLETMCYTAAFIGDGEAETTAPTQKLIAQVNLKTGGGGDASVQIGRHDGVAPFASGIGTDNIANATDINLLTCTAPSLGPQAQLSKGDGEYDILVAKNNAAITNYGIVFHCQENSTGTILHTGTREVHSGSAAPELAGADSNPLFSADADVLINR